MPSGLERIRQLHQALRAKRGRFELAEKPRPQGLSDGLSVAPSEGPNLEGLQVAPSDTPNLDGLQIAPHPDFHPDYAEVIPILPAPEIVEFYRTSEGHIRIVFVDNSPNESGFKIRRYPPLPELEEVASLGANPGTGGRVGWTDTTVGPDSGWRGYAVVAWNAAGESSSNGETTEPPERAPSNLRVFFRRNDWLLEWLDNSERDDGMRVERRELPGVWTEVADLSFLMSQGTGRMTWADRQTRPNTPYEYRVTAHHHGLAVSEVVSAKFDETRSPAVPTDYDLSSDCLELRWMDAATNESGYKIEFSADPEQLPQEVARLPAHSGTGWMSHRLNSSLQTGSYYTYRIIAWNSHGESMLDFGFNVPGPTRPEAPSDLTITATTHNSISLKWRDRSTNELGLTVQRRRAGGQWADVYTITNHGQATGWIGPWTNTGLAPNTEYHYRVKAYNDAGSAFSEEEHARTKPSPAPELVIDSFVENPTTLQAGPNTPFRLYYRVFNVGQLPTETFKDRIPKPGSNGQIAYEKVTRGPVPPGGSYEHAVYFPKGLPAGTYRFFLNVDVDGDVAEQSEQPGYVWATNETPNPTNDVWLDVPFW